MLPKYALVEASEEFDYSWIMHLSEMMIENG